MSWTLAEVEAELKNPNSQYDTRFLKKIQRDLKATEPIIVTCQYTGIQFEAKSRRVKNHPRIAKLLDSANKSGTYRTAVERLSEAREAGMMDLDAIIAYVHAGENEELQERQRREEEQRKAEQRRKHERNDREETNGLLRNHGYRWRKEDEESMDAFGAGAFQATYGDASVVWLLIAPDGREVSVKQAMAEIAATGSNQARRWLEEHTR